ncbi:GIP, partial [Symbiodinium sp. CCMP2456]
MSEAGLRWTVRLGCLWGQVTTYVIPGKAPFLLSRKVLEGMQAKLDLGKLTITSDKHGLSQTPLAQAANGHLLISLLPDVHPEVSFQEGPEEVAFNVEPEGPSEGEAAEPCNSTTADNRVAPKERLPVRITQADLRKHFQTVMKHTRYTQVDVGTHRHPLRMIFGGDVDCALCAYRPRYERTPKQAASKDMYRAVAHLTPKGELQVSEWSARPACARRAEYDRPGACIFAYRHASAEVPETQPVQPPVACSANKTPEAELPDPAEHVPPESLRAEAGTTATPTEQCDCCEPDQSSEETTPAIQESRIARQVEAVRRVPFQLALATLKEQPQQVELELQEWLGPQGSRLAEEIGLIEVFAGAAVLSKQSERRRGLTSIKLGTEYGQDFSRARDRRLLLLLLGRCRPKDVWFSWPSGCWSSWSKGVIAKGGASAKEILARRRQEKPFLSLFEQA